MKAGEVLKILNVSRVTLTSYVKKGKLKVIKKPNGTYDYDEKSVYNLAGQDIRKNIIYCRVSSNKQKKDLIRQINFIEKYCKNKNISTYEIYYEIASGIDLDRKEFSRVLDEVLNGKVKYLFISNKDRLTRLSFLTLEAIFEKFGTKIIVVNDELKKSNKDDGNDKEIYEELISLMHYFSTKMYSSRRKKDLTKLKEKLIE